MAIGVHDCQTARDVDLKGAIQIGLDEALTALGESFADLSDEQAGRFPMPERNNIAWNVMHCLENLHEYAVCCASHFSPSVEPQRLWADEPQWNRWECRPEDRPKPSDSFPTVEQMVDRLQQLRDASMTILERSTSDDLRTPTEGPKPVLADWYIRTICHTVSHTRQIWALRGMMGLVDTGRAWPRQHWA